MEEIIIKENEERYPVQTHDHSEPYVDLEMGQQGWPILFAIPEEEKGNCQTSSREFRWAYGNKIWLVHSDGSIVLYEDISQCWIDHKNEVYTLVARESRTRQVL